MEKLSKLMAQTLPAVVASSATGEEIDRWLSEPTEAVCGICGCQALRRFERFNGRCERCRTGYVLAARKEATADPLCGTCEGSGWKTTGGDRWARCGCRRPADPVTDALLRAGVPAEYAAFDLHGWRGELPAAVMAFLAEPAAQRSIYVHGSPGRGKTHLTTAIFRRLITEGLSGQWRDCPTLVQAARGMLRRGADEEYDAEVFRLQTADVLLLDDLGSELDSEFSRDYLGTLIRSRHAEQRIVIANSNRSLAALVAPKEDGGLGRDPAIGSRLRGLAVEVGGSDQRTRRH